MKLVTILSLVSALVLSACGQDGTPESTACKNSPALGSWYQPAGLFDTMTFNANCRGSNDVCGSVFTYPETMSTSGTALITILSNNGTSGCLPVGQTACSYTFTTISGVQWLQINCGGGIQSFKKL